MTDLQRLTDAERKAICACRAGWQWGHSPSCEDRAAKVERILAARSVRDDPTLRDARSIRLAVELLAEQRDEWHEGGGDWCDGYQAALTDLRAVLAEHAPADDESGVLTCDFCEHQGPTTERGGECGACGARAFHLAPADDPTRQAAASPAPDLLAALQRSMDRAKADRLAATPEDGA